MPGEREIFLEALEQPTAEARAAFVERATAGDLALREAVEALLACHAADTFLQDGPASLLRESLGAAGKLTTPEEQIGDVIGRYRLLEKIGEGGFGVVFRAEQREPVRRHVAVKVIKLGMDTRSIVARFEAERQALALMDHPNIARVFDGGVTATGRPFFVMELVRGVRITEFCEANELPLHGRLTLFIQLCQAIQHAHQKGVIHRDLKPSNVLVTVQDGRPVPKVIDFGVAKAIEEPLTEKTVLTNFHAFIGTPAYTSPEQAEMSATDVDTRSDIYSLGVLLYELLTGVTPFDARELTRSGLDGMRRMIKEVEPPKPSTRLRRAVAMGSTQPSSLAVDRDLDWIVMKCLEKDRARRYDTALELAADLRRYLSEEPVLARPQSAAYRLRKALRRHRAPFVAAAAILIAVAAGSTVSVWQALRATSAERISEQRRKNEELLRHNAEQERERALALQRQAELNEYIADINLTHQAIAAGNLGRATELLTKHNGRGPVRFEWRYLWHEAEGTSHRLLAQEASSIQSLASSKEWLVVGLQDAVRIYNPNTGALIKTLAKAGYSLALSPSGLLATASKNTVRVWRTSDWSEVHALPELAGPVGFSSDGGLLAATAPGGVRVYRSSDGAFVADIPNSMPPFAFSPSTNEIAVDTSNGIVLWDLGTRRALRTLEQSDGMFNAPWLRGIRGLVYSPDGRSIAAARNTLRNGGIYALELWSSATGEKLATLPQHRGSIEHSGVISSIGFDLPGRRLVTGSRDHSIRLWDVDARTCVGRLHGSPSEVWAVAFTPDGVGIISGSKDGTVRRWPTDPAAKERTYEGKWTPIKFSRDGRALAAIDPQSLFVVLNLATGEPNDRLQLTKSPWGQWAGAISDDFSVLVDPLTNGGFRLWDVNSRTSTEIKSPAIHKPWVALSPDGTSLLTGTKDDSALWWNLGDLAEAPIRVPGNRALFARDGSVLVTLHGKVIQVWDRASRSLKTESSVEVDLGFLAAVALSDDGRVLAIGSNAVTESDNAIRLCETGSGKVLGICKGHTQGVRWLAFSPDGETLASVSDDSTLRFWNVRTQQGLLSIQRLADPMMEITFSPDGNWLAARAAGGLRVLDASRDPLGRKHGLERW
jgi:serine/threonine protein kinase/WD40 repeat protein